MKTIKLAVVSGLIVGAGALWINSGVFAQDTGRGSGMGHGMGMGRGMMEKHQGRAHKGNRVRHRIIRKGGGVPAPYTNVKNPLLDDEANIKAGKALFGKQCASCHGISGQGDGDAGRKLTPKPANIAFIMDKWIATDPFLFWSISEGGVPLKTAMPTFKETLSEKQRWQIIHYLRSGLVNKG